MHGNSPTMFISLLKSSMPMYWAKTTIAQKLVKLAKNNSPKIGKNNNSLKITRPMFRHLKKLKIKQKF